MQELEMNGIGAQHSFDKMSELLACEATIQSRLVWVHLASFLSHCAMISKYLSPKSPSGAQKIRMDSLRNALQIDDNSDILTRKARNNIEHFDTRMDNWIGKRVSTVLEVVFLNRAKYTFLNAGEKKIKRVILRDELIFISQNTDDTLDELALQLLMNEVNTIVGKATSWIEQNSDYSFIQYVHN